MRDRLHQDLLDRYLAGECTPEERERVERWRAQHPDNAVMLSALGAALDTEGERSWDVDTAWQRTQSRLSIRANTAGPARGGRTTTDGVRRVPSVVLRLAALLVLALGVISVWRATTAPGGRSPVAEAPDLHEAPIGSTLDVRLADGSEVTLAPGSRLEVPRDLSGRRDVTLEGEALFRVTHMPERPFRVLSGGSAVQVLGTEFDVRTALGDQPLRVAVASGRVSVGREGDTPAAVLEPGQMALLSSDGRAEVEPADLERILAWRRGRIELDELSLANALVELERWYDVELEVRDPDLAGRRVSASFRGEPIEQLLESLTVALGARFERDGRTYTILPGSPPR